MCLLPRWSLNRWSCRPPGSWRTSLRACFARPKPHLICRRRFRVQKQTRSDERGLISVQLVFNLLPSRSLFVRTSNPPTTPGSLRIPYPQFLPSDRARLLHAALHIIFNTELLCSDSNFHLLNFTGRRYRGDSQPLLPLMQSVDLRGGAASICKSALPADLR